MNKERNVKKLTTQKGITLVALIITIIILVILAVVTIRAVNGDGIIAHAENAKNKYQKAQEEEQNMLDELSKHLEGKQNWDLEIVTPVKDTKGNELPVPEGYYYLEGDKDTGFVISDVENDTENVGNQFVWVPVNNINDYKLISWNGELVGSQAENTYSSNKRETDQAEEMNNYAEEMNNNNKDVSILKLINSAKDDAAGAQVNTNKNKSIEIYGGFYIGRYEASYNEETKLIETKKNKTPVTNKTYTYMSLKGVEEENVDDSADSGIRDIASYNNKDFKIQFVALNQAKQDITSMVTGVQWDAMLKWLNSTRGTAYNTIGHKGKSSILTGSNETYKVNNIYDIAGNVSEYVQEYFNNGTENVYRGGNYSLDTLSANLRNHNDGSASELIGTRMAITIGQSGQTGQSGQGKL